MRFVVYALVLLVAPVAADADGAGDPWSFERPLREPPHRHVAPTEVLTESTSTLKQGIGMLLNVWNDVFSAVDVPKCPHYPTCSQFGRESVRNYGPFWGWVMTGNRLAREYPGLFESGHYKLVYKGQLRAWDPPEEAWLWGEHLNSTREDK